MKIKVVKNNNYRIKIKDCNNKLRKSLKVFFLKKKINVGLTK